MNRERVLYLYRYFRSNPKRKRAEALSMAKEVTAFEAKPQRPWLEGWSINGVPAAEYLSRAIAR